jgi:hypothetical protein
MIIYLVSEGCYSDYHIEGAFSTKELAEQYIKQNSPVDGDKDHYGRDFSVEEYELDEKKDEKTEFATVYTVKLALSSGVIGNEIERREDKNVSLISSDHYPTAYVYDHNSVRFESFVQGQSIVDYDEAKKVAAEKVQEWLQKKVEA